MIETPQLWLPDRLRQRREDERLMRQAGLGWQRRWMPQNPCCCGGFECQHCTGSIPEEFAVTIDGVANAAGCTNCADMFNDTHVVISSDLNRCSFYRRFDLACSETVYGSVLFSLTKISGKINWTVYLGAQPDGWTFNFAAFREKEATEDLPPCVFDGEKTLTRYFTENWGYCVGTAATVSISPL